MLQVLAILVLFLAFVVKMPLVSLMAMIPSAILMTGARTLEIGSQYVFNPTIMAYVREPIVVSTSYLATLNIIIFGLGLVLFVYDLFTVIQEELKGKGNIRASNLFRKNEQNNT